MYKMKRKNTALKVKIKTHHLSNQWYPKIVRGKETQFKIDTIGKNISTKKIDTYANDVYLSNQVNIKPRALYTIIRTTRMALKEYRIPFNKMPTIVIVSENEMPTAYGKYDAIHNVVYYVPEIADKNLMGKEFRIIEYHEMWHMKQAEDFRKKGWKITNENKVNYILELCKICKKKIDALNIYNYNVGSISEYAKRMYSIGRYDEVEAEYMAKHRKDG